MLLFCVFLVLMQDLLRVDLEIFSLEFLLFFDNQPFPATVWTSTSACGSRLCFTQNMKDSGSVL